MVGQQFTLRHQGLHRVPEAFQLGNIAHVSRLVAELAIDLRQGRRAQRVVPFTEVDQQQSVIFCRKLRRDGMTNIFDTGESGDHQRQRGGHLALLAAFLPAGFHRHRVFTDRNGQAQRRTQLFAYRFHRLIQASVFARVTCGGHPVSRQLHAIQLANLRGGDVGQRFADGQTARGREVQQGNRGALAHRHRFAVVAVEAGGGHRAVGHRDLPRADHLVAGDHTGHGAVADGHEEGFLGHRRQVQNTVYRISKGNRLAIQRAALGFQGLHIAGHFRRFAEQNVQRQVDRLIVKVAVAQAQVLLRGSFADNGIRRAFAATQFVEQRQLLRGDRQNITLLRFVTPDLQRAHPWLIAENIAQLEFTAAAAVAHQLRHGVGETARANVVDKEDRVGVAQLPAAVDHFLTAAFHFRVVTLYGGEIEVGIGLAGGHRRGRAAAEADVHRRAAQHDQLRPDGNLALLHMLAADVADTAGQHDRFVVAAQLFAIVAGDFLFIGAEVAVQRRTTKLVVKRRAAQRAFGHDVQGRDNAVRFTEIFFPRLLEARNTQVGNREAHQARFRLRAAAGGAFITDFAAGAGCRARPWRDGRRVVMGFHLHQNVRRLLMEVVAPGLVVGKIAPHFRPFHHRGIVFIGRQDVVRRFFEGVFDHFEQRLRLLFAVDDPVGVENLVATMLRVRLSEHIQLNIVRVAAQTGKRILQVVNFVICQRQPQTEVGVNQRLTAFAQQVNAGDRRRLMMGKQRLARFQGVEDALHHAVVQFRRHGGPLRFGQG